MNINEKIPSKILIDTELLRSTLSKNDTKTKLIKTYENSLNLLIATAGGLLSCLLVLVPSWTIWGNMLKIVVSIFTLLFFLSSLWFLFKVIQSKTELNNYLSEPLEECIFNEVKNRIRYTALLIISYRVPETGEVKLMLEKKDNYLIHCDMNSQKSSEEQKADIINFLVNSYNIPEQRIEDVIPLSSDPFFSIKPIHGEETQNGFIFFQIKLKKKAKKNLFEHDNVLWKSIQEMEAIPEIMATNYDIILSLNEIRSKITDSFENTYGPLHIIWNITQSCPYNCAFCATKDVSRKELSTEEKLKVLDNLYSSRKYISTLDFAGGDPIYDDKIRTVIMQAINSIGEDKISVTTTGKGITSASDISEEDLSRLLKKCEITIDASHENLSSSSLNSTFSRNSPEYSNNNYTQIISISDSSQYLTINIPLVDDDLTEEEIDILIAKLSAIQKYYKGKQIETQLIRLMPVGAFCSSNKENYLKYNPIFLAKKLKIRIEGIKIPCRYHCSLRVLPSIEACDKRCNMLDKKLGIDCSGNVFACPWGAYLHNTNITNNPFYLGNLVSTKLKDILEGQYKKTEAYKRIYNDVKNNTNKPYCEVVSYYINDTIEENNDPLFKKN